MNSLVDQFVYVLLELLVITAVVHFALWVRLVQLTSFNPLTLLADLNDRLICFRVEGGCSLPISFPHQRQIDNSVVLLGQCLCGAFKCFPGCKTRVATIVLIGY